MQIPRSRSEIGLAISIIIFSGASPSLLIFPPLGIISFVAFRDVVVFPSVVAIFAVAILSRSRFPQLTHRIFIGMVAGAISSFALEAIRIPGYLVLKWIPMDSMISLPGLFLTEKISALSDVRQVIMQSGVAMNLYHAPLDAFIAGTLWHFWNGAIFGIIYAIMIGKGRWWYGIIWAAIIEMAMMMAPYLIMMKGPFGIEHMDGYNLFVITLIAHLAFGALLGLLVQRWKKGDDSILTLGKGVA